MMDKPKAKNNSNPTPIKEKFDFVIVWGITYAAIWMTLWVFLNPFNAPFGVFRLSQMIPNAILVFLLTLVAAYPQQKTGEQLLKRSLRGWPLANALGILFSVFIFTPLYSTVSQDWFIAALALLLPMALVQTVWLKLHIKSAWLWLLVNLIAVPLFILPLREGGSWTSTVFVTLLLGAIQGVIRAFVIHHLMFRRENEKVKHGVTSDHQATPQRLSLTESTQTLMAEEPFEQRQSR